MKSVEQEKILKPIAQWSEVKMESDEQRKGTGHENNKIIERTKKKS